MWKYVIFSECYTDIFWTLISAAADAAEETPAAAAEALTDGKPDRGFV